jgi:hypothetical protein
MIDLLQEINELKKDKHALLTINELNSYGTAVDEKIHIELPVYK